jgi:hypothetical protein
VGSSEVLVAQVVGACAMVVAVAVRVVGACAAVVAEVGADD